MSESCPSCDELRQRLSQREGRFHDVIESMKAERDEALRKVRALLVDHSPEPSRAVPLD